MKVVEVRKIEDCISDLKEVTATLGFIQTAFAEGRLINMKAASEALFLLYKIQREVLDNISKELYGGGTDE